jgi:intein/homing endonuclease
MIHQIKQQFNASINSSANCLEGSSVIWTKQYGAITIAELENKVKGVDKIDVWTGTNWEKATAYKTGLKSLVTTKTANGFVQKTSPNHKFTIIDENGDFVWRTQDKLKVGDFVAINKRPIEGGEAPLFNGKKITPEFMEVLGWMSGDGCINDSGLTLYYHHEKELDVRERHAKILKDFGVNVRIVDQEISIEEQEKIKARYGFKSCAAVRTSIRCYSVDVGRAIGGLGFNYSDEGKNVPSWIYSINDELRCSYLKGLFSADGNNHKLISPCITIASESMRDSVKLLLAASGIRCTLSEGRTKIKILGPGREIVESKSVLRVKDRKEFFERVGFLQPHKQPRQPKGTNKDWGTSSSIARSVIVRYLKMVKGKTKLPRGGSTHNLGSVRVFTKRQQMDIDAVLRGDNSCSLNRLMNYMKIAQVEIPEWMNDFCFEPIVEIGTVGVKVEMYDMEVSDKNHAFMVNAARSHNSWRMPVFGVPTDGEITWQPIDAGGGRDAEFQYLTDMNAREILTAFMMSPDELPGWSYLSRGTASQALSESNNEYKLEASRDVGIRPLLASFEDFINAELFPLIDADLAKKARVSLMGLDADSPEKEATRLESVGEIYGTMDDILQKVEKTPVGKEWGGEFLLNPAYQAILDKYFLVGDIKEHFFGHKGASKDPQWQFSMNPVWLQVKQMEMQAQAQQQQAQQQAQGPQDGGGGGGQPGGGGGAPDDSSGGGEGPQRENPGDDQTEKQRSESSQQAPQTPAPSANDLGKAVSMAWDLMQKSENNLPPEKRKILDQHKKTVEWFTRGFERDIKDATREILDTARQMSPKAK